MPVKERPFFFGKDHPLFGILSESEEAERRKTGIVLLNSGLVHRAGPFRLGVEIARGLAAEGFPVLRFDQSARGDSYRRKGIDVVEAANLDIGVAKEAMRSHANVDKIVLAGLCSGADDIVRHIGDDDGVSGLILMDPYAARTAAFALHHFIPRIFSLPRWFRFLRRKLSSVTQEAGSAADDLGSFREFPEHHHAADAFRAISKRGGASLCLFTSGVHYYYNHQGQLTSGLGLKDVADDVEEVFFKTAEHTYPLTVHRRELVEIITAFGRRRFD